jgi:hypothetical protein
MNPLQPSSREIVMGLGMTTLSIVIVFFLARWLLRWSKSR